MIDKVRVTVTTTGVAGSASGNALTPRPVNGRLIAVHFDWTSQPATTDTTVTMEGTPSRTLLTLTDTNTDGWYYPRTLLHGETGSALTGTAGGDREPYVVEDYLKVAIAQGDAHAAAVVATFYIEC